MKRDTKTLMFKFRLTEKEKNFINTQAEALGIPTSEYIRARALGFELRTKTDAAVLNELRKLGGLCKHLYNEGANPTETGAALAALTSAATRMLRQ